jgi:hypothetical protein
MVEFGATTGTKNVSVSEPFPRFDWNEQLLRDVARWTNGFAYKTIPFSEYRRSAKGRERYDPQQGLFL